MKARGFTLIEILITLVILSVSLLAIAGLMSLASGSNASGGHLTEAATLAQDKLEEFRGMPWESIPEGTDNDQRVGSTFIRYTRTWGIRTSGNLKTITLTITWNDQRSHSITFTSGVSRLG